MNPTADDETSDYFFGGRTDKTIFSSRYVNTARKTMQIASHLWLARKASVRVCEGRGHSPDDAGAALPNKGDPPRRSDVRRNRALNCWPWVRSLIHSPEAVTSYTTVGARPRAFEHGASIA